MTDEDRALAERLVEKGLASREQIDQCIRELLPGQALAELLIQRGHLSRDAFEATLKSTRSAAPVTVPDEVREALLHPSSDLGRYVKVRILGKGGMGEVWRAWDKDLARFVAIKFVPEEEVRKEAQIVARLSHPNIAQVYEVGPGFIVMQLVNGVTIDQSRENPIRILRDAARAVDYAHRQGVIHRDLKPSNIMMEGDRVFVMDFGLARRVDASLSASGILGTPEFMSPEQAAGHSHGVDGRTDVYSLGATLYALLCGRPPHRQTDLMALLKSVCQDPPAPMLGVPRELETIVLKCLEKDRGRRYPTAGDLGDDLDRFLNGDPIRARRAGLAYRIRKRLFKHRWLAAAAALAAATGLGFAGYVAYTAGVRSGERRIATRKFQEAERESDPTRRLSLYREAAPWLPEARAKADEMERLLRERRERDELHADRYRRGVDEWLRSLEFDRSGNSAGRDRSVDQARAHFHAANEAVERAPAWHMIGRCLQIHGGSLEAGSAMEQALRCDSRYEPAMLDLAKLLLGRYRRDRGMPSAYGGAGGTFFVPLRPESAEQARIRQRAEDLARSLAAARIERHQTDLVEALLQMGLGYYEPAANGFERYLGEESWDAEAEELYGQCLFQLLKFDSAHAAFQRALSRGATSGRWLLCGRALAAKGDTEGSLLAYQRALELDDRNVKALVGRAWVLRSRRDFSGAMADCRKAIEIEPEYDGAYYIRGMVRRSLEDWTGAIEDFTRAVEINPRDTVVLGARGDTRKWTGDVKGAVEDYSRALAINPLDANALLERAEGRRYLKDWEGATADCRRLIELMPDLAEGYDLLGGIFAARGEYDAAIAEFDRALRLAPQYAEGFAHRGWARRNQGDLAGALSDLDRAVELSTRHGWILVNRAVLREHLAGREPERAREHLRSAERDLVLALEQVWPNPANRADAEKRLAQVRERLARSSQDEP